MYVSIRTYRVGAGSVDDLMHRVDRDLAEAFAQEPGFISYHVAQTGDRMVKPADAGEEVDEAEVHEVEVTRM